MRVIVAVFLHVEGLVLLLQLDTDIDVDVAVIRIIRVILDIAPGKVCLLYTSDAADD